MQQRDIILLIALAAFYILSRFLHNKKTKKNQPKTREISKTESSQPLEESFDYTKGYKSKWMFTYNEKEAFSKIKEITDEMGLHLFAKVRLFDLIEPKQGIENRQAHQWKIQAKHVDFVVCDKKLVARMIIELDDASHDTQTGVKRDIFVDSVLQSCGYKVFHIRTVEPEKLKPTIQFIFAPETIAQ